MTLMSVSGRALSSATVGRGPRTSAVAPSRRATRHLDRPASLAPNARSSWSSSPLNAAWSTLPRVSSLNVSSNASSASRLPPVAAGERMAGDPGITSPRLNFRSMVASFFSNAASVFQMASLSWKPRSSSVKTTSRFWRSRSTVAMRASAREARSCSALQAICRLVISRAILFSLMSLSMASILASSTPLECCACLTCAFARLLLASRSSFAEAVSASGASLRSFR
mmetsp:Transcript_88366/g.250432  ORF Transcript_88366/g.250432 Transcript_88366/m.250432 type:complete len:226 (-) Transcript_88366:1212-1889(-)